MIANTSGGEIVKMKVLSFSIPSTKTFRYNLTSVGHQEYDIYTYMIITGT